MTKADQVRKNLLGFANGLPTIVLDAGNALVKAYLDIPEGDTRFVSFAHGLIEIDKGTYERLRYYALEATHLLSFFDENTRLFRFFVVGDEAFGINPSFDPLRGRAKYQRDYYGILFCRVLLDLFGHDLPEKINVLLAHPPGDLAYIESLKNSVGGKWWFESGGTQYRTTVVYANVFDEVVGGVFNATTDSYGNTLKTAGIIGDGPTIGFDWGGGTLDLVRLNRNGSVDYTKPMRSERIGINRAVLTFKSAFDSQYSGLLANDENGIPRAKILGIFMDPHHCTRMYGETLDCKDLYNQAMNQLLREAYQAVLQFTGGLADYNRVLLTGGASALAVEEIKEHIFPNHAKNNVIHLADERDQLFKANAKGGTKILEGLRIQGQLAARNYHG